MVVLTMGGGGGGGPGGALRRYYWEPDVREIKQETKPRPMDVDPDGQTPMGGGSLGILPSIRNNDAD
jgi:hypothetical protein